MSEDIKNKNMLNDDIQKKNNTKNIAEILHTINYKKTQN